MAQEKQDEVNYELSKFSNQLGILHNKIMVNNVEFLEFKENIQKNMENMASKEDLEKMISEMASKEDLAKMDLQEVKAMLNEIRHSFLPNSSPQEKDKEEEKDLFQS